jgi:hypothetical protein
MHTGPQLTSVTVSLIVRLQAQHVDERHFVLTAVSSYVALHVLTGCCVCPLTLTVVTSRWLLGYYWWLYPAPLITLTHL